MRRALLALLLVAAMPAAAAGTVPLRALFVDESGRAVSLGDYFGGVPVVLVLGYFECRDLCSTIMDGVLESLARSDLPPSSYTLLAVSVDPREDAAAARRRMAAYRPILAGAVRAHFLTGSAASSQALAAAAGVQVRWDAEHGVYEHSAGFVVATPDGRLARRFDGVRFDARDVRLALVEASAGRAGSLGDRLILLCSHFDPQTGRYTGAALTAVRLVGAAVAFALGAWIWRRRGGRA